MEISFGQSMIRCARAAPFVVCMVMTLAIVSCEEEGGDGGGVRLAGSVFSAVALSPIESAKVRLVSGDFDLTAFTDSAGVFALSTFHGEAYLSDALVTVSRAGFARLDTVFARLEGSSARDLEFRLILLE